VYEPPSTSAPEAFCAGRVSGRYAVRVRPRKRHRGTGARCGASRWPGAIPAGLGAEIPPPRRRRGGSRVGDLPPPDDRPTIIPPPGNFTFILPPHPSSARPSHVGPIPCRIGLLGGTTIGPAHDAVLLRRLHRYGPIPHYGADKQLPRSAPLSRQDSHALCWALISPRSSFDFAACPLRKWCKNRRRWQPGGRCPPCLPRRTGVPRGSELPDSDCERAFL